MLLKGQTFEIEDMTSCEFQVIDTVARVFDGMVELAKESHNNAALEEWKFIKEWETLTFIEKYKNYDKFSSHELNLFIYCKDRAFFDAFVKVYIQNKL